MAERGPGEGSRNGGERTDPSLDVDPARGLTAAEVQRRRGLYGPNQLPEPPRPSELLRFAKQLANPLILTLIAAAGVALVVGWSAEGSVLSRFGDAFAIFAIVLLNAVLGYVQERKAETAIAALQRLTSSQARVRRDGEVQLVDAADLVPGDILEIEAGDAIPADARLLSSAELATDESALTGESQPSSKSARSTAPSDAPLAERDNAVFFGTTAVRGKAEATVTATGEATQIGRIGRALSQSGHEPSPLEQRLALFGQRILWACLAISGLLFAWGIAVGRAWHAVLLEAVSFAVAVIPEGLPAITTITLAVGMQRMAKKGAIIRRLPAVETLGAATVLCVDKTGTLTQNQMTVRELFTGGHRYTVSGLGYAPEGVVVRADGSTPDPDDTTLAELAESAALCNGAEVGRHPETGAWRVIGDPMEGALLVLAAKAGVARDEMRLRHPRVRELPFDSDRKCMTVVTRDASGRLTGHVKGGIDVLLPRCVRVAAGGANRPMQEADRADILADAERMSGRALRVLLIARSAPSDGGDPETDLTFVGIVGLMDPPRAGSRGAVEACRRAGVRVVMITGDHPTTATAIARELDLWAPGDVVLTGPELARMSDDALARRVDEIRVFARTTPEQKLRIVKALKAHGHVVAMTGDGVNDAPALREAHIGVAMGLGGTDVARQAADIVITDDDFATIVEAIRQGRAIYRNIQKVIFFLLSSNAGLSIAVFAISFSTVWLPLLPLMILWINLVTNGLPALALGVDAPDEAQMSEPPRSSKTRLLSGRDYLGVAFVGVLMGGAAVCLYAIPGLRGSGEARTLAFSLLAVAPLFHAWSARSPTESIFTIRPWFSGPLLLACALSAAIHLSAVVFPSLRAVFHTEAMAPSAWMVLVLLSFGLVAAVEVAKIGWRLVVARPPDG